MTTPSQHDDQVSAIRGVDLAWRRSGAGLPLVWGHGLSSSRADEDTFGLLDWELIPDLDLLRYDARGHGQSGFTTEPAAYSWEELAMDQLALESIRASEYRFCAIDKHWPGRVANLFVVFYHDARD